MTKDAEIKERIQQIVESLDSEQLTQLWDYLETLLGGEHVGFAEARPVYAVMKQAEKTTRKVIDLDVGELENIVYFATLDALQDASPIDPDEGLELREEFIEELEQSLREHEAGKTLTFEEVIERLGLE